MADAFNAAFRIPNFLQNLFGEGVLSASFIPVYAKLRGKNEDDTAVRVAESVFGLLALTTSGIVVVGVLAAEPLTSVLAPGFAGGKRELTVQLVRIFFPGAGLLAMSAWCLGILNGHRRFLLSYTAPVLWNLAIIVALIVGGGRTEPPALAMLAAWGSLVGSGLQFGVQLPTVLRLMGRLRPRLDTGSPPVRTVIGNFGPAFVGRGVVQLSAFVDTILASLLPGGAVAGLASAQVLYTLPVSLFGMSVSAAELPEMSREADPGEQASAQLRSRLSGGLSRIAYFVVPSAAAFLACGGVIAGALFQSGRFGAADSNYVWGILAGSAVGLLAATSGRLYASAYYALGDTRTPLRYAVLRVVLTTALGYLFAVPLPPLLGLEPRWGAAGLTISAGLAGWLEFLLLRRGLATKIGPSGLPPGRLPRLWVAAAGGAGVGVVIRSMAGGLGPIPLAAAALIPFGLTYFGLTLLLAVPEAQAVRARLRR